MKKQTGGLKRLVAAVALSVAFQNSHALGLGELTVDSTLGQPLSAHIPFTSITGKEKKKLAASLAPRKDFEAAGLDYPAFLSQLKVTVSGKGRNQQLLITTEKPVRDPVIQLLLKVDWAEGQLVREYTALLDPPVFRKNDRSVRPVPAVVSRTAKNKPAASRPAPTVTSTRKAAASSGSSAAAPASAAHDIPDTYGPVRKGDSLWRIAEAAYGVSDVRLLQAMEAMLEANPDAFIKHNVHGLMAGVTLKLPPLTEVTRIAPKQAYRKFVAQTEQWKTVVQASAADASQRAQASAPDSAEKPRAAMPPAQAKQETKPVAKPADAEGKLEIIVADSKPVSGAAAPQGSTQNNAGPSELKKRVAVLEEALASKESESSELLQRVQLLEEQLNKARQLIQVQNAELARIQSQMQAAAAEPQSEVATEASARAAEQAAPSAEATQAPAAAGPDSANATAGQPSATVPADSQNSDSGAEASAATSAQAAPVAAIAETEGATPVTETAPESASPDADTEQPSGKISDRPMFEERQAENRQAAVEAPESDANSEDVNPAETAVRPRIVARDVSDDDGAPGFLDRAKETFASISSGSYFLPLLGGLALGGLGLLFVRRRRSVADFEESILATSTFETQSDFGASIDETKAETTFLNDFGGDGDQADMEDVDPITEAEVYLAYGRVDQAAEILEEAIKKEPERQALKLKLLEVFAQKDDVKSFEALAEEMYANAGDDPAIWNSVAEMGRKLSPANPLFAAAADADSSEDDRPAATASGNSGAQPESDDAQQEQVTGARKPQSTPFDGLGVGEQADQQGEPEQAYSEPEHQPVTGATETGSDGTSNPLDVAALDDAVEFTPPQSEPLSEPLEDIASMDEKLVVESGQESVTPNHDRTDETGSEPHRESTSNKLDSLDFDTEIPIFNDFSDDALPEGILGDGAGESGDWDENTTKLDLAKAYIDMGDGDGARSILGEVLNQGNEEQKKQAAELMAQVG